MFKLHSLNFDRNFGWKQFWATLVIHGLYGFILTGFHYNGWEDQRNYLQPDASFNSSNIRLL